MKAIELGAKLAIANWHWILFAAGVAAISLLFRSYFIWRRGWLSGLVEKQLAQIKVIRRRDRFASFKHLSLQHLTWVARSLLFTQIQRAEQYITSAPNRIKNIYFPSGTSFLIIFVGLSLLFIAPHIFGFLPKTKESPFATLWNKDVIEKVFEGLIVIGVALRRILLTPILGRVGFTGCAHCKFLGS